MLEDEGNLSWRATALRAVPQLASLCLAVGGGVAFSGTLQLLLMAAGVGGIATYSFWWEVNLRRRIHQAGYNECRLRVEGILETARRFLAASGARDVRANVMMFIRSDATCAWGGMGTMGLRIRFTSSGFLDQQKKNIWPRSRGCAGVAWEKGKKILGVQEGAPEPDVTPLPDVEICTLLRLSNVPKDVVSVLSLPLFDARGTIIGVLNFDDQNPAHLSPMSRPIVVDAMDKVAGDVSRLLVRYQATLLASPLWPPEEADDAVADLQAQIVAAEQPKLAPALHEEGEVPRP